MTQESSDSGAMPSPSSFANLMALKPLGNAEVPPSQPERVELFQSLAVPFTPGSRGVAFGGHVYAQSAYAASKTVKAGFVIHDIAGTFILPGRLDVPYIYAVRHLRDGKGYCSRAVDVRQGGEICFSCLCSFKRDEAPIAVSHQPPPVQERFKKILAARRPEDQPPSVGVDADFWIELLESGAVSEAPFPGLDVRKVDMLDYNTTDEVKAGPEKYRQLTMYSIRGSPLEEASGLASREELKKREDSGEFDNLYACAHMYSSDKNSLLLIPRALGYKTFAAMASLTLTVVFHQHGKALRMIDWDSTEGGEELPKKWFIQEGWSPRSGENRAIHESWLWSPDGQLMGTSYQDSLLRLAGRGEKL
ncbi:acyl-CoA thioesterase [Aspergillus campestris IBT 28561]|uniref:Acyl-CoA thioesterase n=1 Tax=Aspergillus campestris (strain IBT 28561) TaxID=1392248 RepID=A0A2I1DFX7_ASPC2|nr:acyl-CoA thioesterase [Aspergillus campestris IBT 28561]PKY08774.1 acyl-CoA thioesterase [Aspergillus campestris IBT 28561]